MYVPVTCLEYYLIRTNRRMASKAFCSPCSSVRCTCGGYSSSFCCRHGDKSTLLPCRDQRTASRQSCVHNDTPPRCSCHREGTRLDDIRTHTCERCLEMINNCRVKIVCTYIYTFILKNNFRSTCTNKCTCRSLKIFMNIQVEAYTCTL